MEMDQETEKKFTYPGPLPYSKETAVLMMADAVEAASRSLIRPTKDSLENLVEKIIDQQIKLDQFVNSNITFKDIKKTKKIFKKMLQSIYHVRVEYPN
jgi:membrane-associated HD superfamily phosphohydrolase